jgi:hypothetical protein
MANINKQHFLLAGSCAVVLSVFSRSSLGKIGEGIREVNEIVILRKVLFAQAQVVPLKRGDGSGAAVAAHGVSGGSTRREILGGISPSTGQVSGAINASAEQMLRLKSAGMFWQSIRVQQAGRNE